MKNLTFPIWLLFLLGSMLQTTSCNPTDKVDDRFLGEYNGIIGVPNEMAPLVTDYEDGTLLIEKSSKKKYEVSSPSHPSDFGATTYVINVLLFGVDTVAQYAIEDEVSIGSGGVLIFTERGDSIFVYVTKGEYPEQVSFTGVKPN